MNDALEPLGLHIAGRDVENGWDRIRRYCGLPWSGGEPETWAYRYYDALPRAKVAITPVDLLAAGSLHPGLSRSDLAEFWDHADELTDWVGLIPSDATLRDIGTTLMAKLDQLSMLDVGLPFSLLTKVMHRVRPGLIPIVDREVVDWYRPVTGERRATAAWPNLLRCLRDDLGGQNALHLALMNSHLEQELGHGLSHLRMLDIVIWMGAQP